MCREIHNRHITAVPSTQRTKKSARKDSPIEKGAKYWTGNDRIGDPNDQSNVKGSSNSSVVREIQSKAAKYYLTQIIMAKIRTFNGASCRPGCRAAAI